MKFDISKLHERKRLEKVLELMEIGEDEGTSNEKKTAGGEEGYDSIRMNTNFRFG
jgi:hypothetical protein